jgi:hypothetical protein
VELNELDRLTENGPVYERQGEAQQQRKEWENSALLSKKGTVRGAFFVNVHWNLPASRAHACALATRRVH